MYHRHPLRRNANANTKMPLQKKTHLYHQHSRTRNQRYAASGCASASASASAAASVPISISMSMSMSMLSPTRMQRCSSGGYVLVSPCGVRLRVGMGMVGGGEDWDWGLIDVWDAGMRDASTARRSCAFVHTCSRASLPRRQTGEQLLPVREALA